MGGLKLRHLRQSQRPAWNHDPSTHPRRPTLDHTPAYGTPIRRQRGRRRVRAVTVGLFTRGTAGPSRSI